MSKKGMGLLDSFSLVKFKEGSTLFSFSVISSILIFWSKKISISSIYFKYVVLLGGLYLKGPDSKNSIFLNTPTLSLQKENFPLSTCVLVMTQKSDGESPVMLELWGMRSTHSLSSPPPQVHSGPE